MARNEWVEDKLLLQVSLEMPTCYKTKKQRFEESRQCRDPLCWCQRFLRLFPHEVRLTSTPTLWHRSVHAGGWPSRYLTTVEVPLPRVHSYRKRCLWTKRSPWTARDLVTSGACNSHYVRSIAAPQAALFPVHGYCLWCFLVFSRPRHPQGFRKLSCCWAELMFRDPESRWGRRWSGPCRTEGGSVRTLAAADLRGIRWPGLN